MSKRGTSATAFGRCSATLGRPTQDWFVIRRSSIHGRGAFALRRIPAGTRLIEYTGERITPEEAAQRYDDDAMEHAHTFLFTVDDETVIDGARGGNEARYINHSCEPNCEAVDEDGRIFIYALRDIAPGEEITYDYHLERTGGLPRNWRTLYACHCGAPSCRGTMLDRPPRRPRRASGQPAGRSARRASRSRSSNGRRGP